MRLSNAPTLRIVVILLLPFLSGCGKNDTTAGGSGLLETDEAVVSAETAGRVISLRFDEGSQLREGDTLLMIDASRAELELRSAIAGQQVAHARLQSSRLQLLQTEETEQFAASERRRVESLVRSGTATPKQLDQLEHEHTLAEVARQAAAANIAAIEAELGKIEVDLGRIRRQLQDFYPVSPSAGTVTEKYVELGELLVPGKPIAKISRLDTLWVKVYLPTGDFASVRVGDQATVDTESGGIRYTGTVVWTAGEAEFTPKNVQTRKSRTNLVYAVKVRVANTDGNLKIGMPVFVTIAR
ncbi:MAG TPA: HlyD family efflux transporter periplasmic adaptor subunit [Candidatus Deferrimicrobium sp.]|nr:HlyD family efflux transporter periplasmic adaptor subunit [Candidatus Deferrimicrobium sp.]